MTGDKLEVGGVASATPISSARAIRELRRRCVSAEAIARFLDETGHQGWYDVQAVLDWIGR